MLGGRGEEGHVMGAKGAQCFDRTRLPAYGNWVLWEDAGVDGYPWSHGRVDHVSFGFRGQYCMAMGHSGATRRSGFPRNATCFNPATKKWSNDHIQTAGWSQGAGLDFAAGASLYNVSLPNDVGWDHEVFCLFGGKGFSSGINDKAQCYSGLLQEWFDVPAEPKLALYKHTATSFRNAICITGGRTKSGHPDEPSSTAVRCFGKLPPTTPTSTATSTATTTGTTTDTNPAPFPIDPYNSLF